MTYYLAEVQAAVTAQSVQNLHVPWVYSGITKNSKSNTEMHFKPRIKEHLALLTQTTVTSNV